MQYLVFIVAGFASGIIAGMGMGGGTLLIPALTLVAGIGQHEAQGINMLCFLPAALTAILVHRKEGRLEFKRCIPVIIGGTAGAVLGALLALALDGAWLRRLFGAFLLVLAVIQFINGEKSKK